MTRPKMTGNDMNEAGIKGPHPIDLRVGAAVRMRRKTLGISQSDLATALQLTFQQVQKYERGANRISASKLFEIAQFLKMPIAAFYKGLDDPDSFGEFVESPSEKDVHSFLMTNEGVELARTFPKIRQTSVKRKVLDLVRALAETADNDA